MEEGDCDKDFEHGGNQHHVPGGVGRWHRGEPQDHWGLSQWPDPAGWWA